MRGNMPFDLSHDAPLSPVPADVQADIERMSALWAECRSVATEPGPYLFGRVSLADVFFAPVAVRLRTYQVTLSAVDEAYVRNPLPMASVQGLAEGRHWRRSSGETSTRGRRRYP